MLSFKITITPKDGKSTVYVRIDQWKDGRWALFDMYVTSSKNASSMLVLEKEKREQEMYYLEIDDRRDYFLLV